MAMNGKSFVRWPGTGSLLAFLLVARSVLSSVLYVDVNGNNPTPPYPDWATAATNIQDAVDAATTGDLVLVTNGIYQNGGRAIASLTNRVTVTNGINVQSVTG